MSVVAVMWDAGSALGEEYRAGFLGSRRHSQGEQGLAGEEQAGGGRGSCLCGGPGGRERAAGLAEPKASISVSSPGVCV